MEIQTDSSGELVSCSHWMPRSTSHLGMFWPRCVYLDFRCLGIGELAALGAVALGSSASLLYG